MTSISGDDDFEYLHVSLELFNVVCLIWPLWPVAVPSERNAHFSKFKERGRQTTLDLISVNLRPEVVIPNLGKYGCWGIPHYIAQVTSLIATFEFTFQVPFPLIDAEANGSSVDFTIFDFDNSSSCAKKIIGLELWNEYQCFRIKDFILATLWNSDHYLTIKKKRR